MSRMTHHHQRFIGFRQTRMVQPGGPSHGRPGQVVYSCRGRERVDWTTPQAIHLSIRPFNNMNTCLKFTCVSRRGGSSLHQFTCIYCLYCISISAICSTTMSICMEERDGAHFRYNTRINYTICRVGTPQTFFYFLYFCVAIFFIWM